jgi:two-component system response regulator HydG
MPVRSLYLVVARGPDAGARVLVDDTSRLVGRSREADLVLVDRHVSRRHLRVVAEGEAARLVVCDGAEPILVDGAPRRETVLRVGEGLVLGETTLVLATDAERPPPSTRLDDATRTDVRALMTGVAADVRGLAAAMEIVDALDAAADEAAVADALRAWGAAHVQATDVAIAVGEEASADLRAIDASGQSLVERAGPAPGTALLSVPAHGDELVWITFTCALGPGGRLTDTTRRLVAIAARVGGLGITRMRALRRVEDERETFRRASLGSARSFLGDSAAAREVSKLVGRLAASDVVVLLEGETGVGKTFLARLIHESSPRAKEPLKVINCAAIPDALIEGELFGHERGAFTGATTSRAGALEAAGDGTVLLDEIGELPLASQAKLLRVLEEKRFERLGSNRAIPLAARVLTATNRDLARMADEGTFRRDLYYRIAVVKLRVPPLRERGDDLVLLAERMLADLAASAGRRVAGFSPAALDVVRRYAWPGNVRELRNAIERALVVGEGARIEPGDLPDVVHGAPPEQPKDESIVQLPARLDVIEERAIRAALQATGGNQRKAAVLLGINRVTLHRKLRAGAAGGAPDANDADDDE